jgi:MscS family membrane protein
MIEIGGFPINLPETLLWLDDITIIFVLNIVFWLAIGYAIYFIFFRLAKRFVRNVRGSLDDTFLDIVRVPLLIGVLVFGLANALSGLGLIDVVVDWVFRIRNFLLTWLGAWAIWRVFNEVIIYYGQRAVMRSSDKVDDILLPILQQFGRIIILVLSVFFSLQYLGIDLTGLWVAIGGAAFILAFALQDILGNMFASLAMLVDTPFKYGDLISLEKGSVYRVERIGVRVTELYDTTTHSVIFMPNSSLTGKQLTNLTKPSIDLRTFLDVTVSGDIEPHKVRDVLLTAAEAHPNVLSRIPRKLELMADKIAEFAEMGYWQRVHDYVEDINRLRVEHELNEAVAALDTTLEQLADRIDEMEEDGLDDVEKSIIQEGLDEADYLVETVAHHFTRWIMAMRYRMSQRLEERDEAVDPAELTERTARYTALIDDELQAGKIPLLGSLPEGHISELKVKRAMSNLVRRNGMEGFDRGFKDIQNRRELENLIRGWDYRIVDLRENLETLRYSLRSGNEQRLDDAMRGAEDWLHTSFKELTPEWKYPDVTLTTCGGSMTFRLEVQIDNVNLEYFGRQSRVESELRKEILRSLRKNGIQV